MSIPSRQFFDKRRYKEVKSKRIIKKRKSKEREIMYRFSIVAVAVFFMVAAASAVLWTTVVQAEETTIEQTFAKAKKDYLGKNIISAAKQIRKSVKYLENETVNASDKGKQKLAAAAGELEKLAADMEKGSVKSVKRMNEAFARAYHALAANEHLKSTESWAKKETAKAGSALDAAAKYLEKSFAWAGKKIEAKTGTVIRKSQDISRKLTEKGDAVAEEIGRGLQDAGIEIEKFGKRIFPK